MDSGRNRAMRQGRGGWHRKQGTMQTKLSQVTMKRSRGSQREVRAPKMMMNEISTARMEPCQWGPGGLSVKGQKS